MHIHSGQYALSLTVPFYTREHLIRFELDFENLRDHRSFSFATLIVYQWSHVVAIALMSSVSLCCSITFADIC